MNVLIIGSGGREHALAWKLAKSPKLGKLFVAPGNAGTAQIAVNVDIGVNQFEKIKELVLTEQVTMVVVGPEEPLVNGIYDYFINDSQLKDIPVIGPSKIGAQLEGSKEFAKQFMQKYQIPTAAYQSFTLNTLNEGKVFLEKLKAPYVLKADGLAAGKGVLILNNLKEAQDALETMLNGQFGKASSKVVIEEFLSGIEVSYFVLTDGNSYVLLPEAKDYKRIGEKDTGPNTGGMGAVSPVPFCTPEFTQKVIDRIIEPTIKGLKQENIPYRGFIFFGLIKVNNEPFVIEYNVRMGDPETEVVIPRVKTDLLELFLAAANGNLNQIKHDTDKQAAITVVMVSGGYPGDYQKGFEVSIKNTDESIVFHAGTQLQNSKIVTSGGRVLAITSMDADMQQALQKSYAAIERIAFDGAYYRRDIGLDLQN